MRLYAANVIEILLKKKNRRLKIHINKIIILLREAASCTANGKTRQTNEL